MEIHITFRITIRPSLCVGNITVKVDGSDVTKVSVKRFSYRQIHWLTSLPSSLTEKESMKMTFSADKIYYNVSQENSKVTNM